MAEDEGASAAQQPKQTAAN